MPLNKRRKRPSNRALVRRMDCQDQSMEMKFGGGEVGGLELCIVCGDRASGRHYGAISCEGCKGFFKRSIRKKLGYQCRGSMNCEVTKHHRNRCQHCRLQKCLACGMRSDSVQHERKPIMDRVKTETRDSSLHDSRAVYSKLLGLAGQSGQQINTKEEPNESFAPVSPAAPAINLFAAAAVAFNKGGPSVSPYRNAPSSTTTQQQQLMLQTHFANNLLKIGQIGAINDYLQSYAAPSDVPLGPPQQEAHVEEPDSLLRTADTIRLPLVVPTAPAHFRLQALCESGARLLAALCRWTAAVAAPTALPFEFQVTLLKKCWPELFVLGLVKYSQALQLPSMIPLLVSHLNGILRTRTTSRDDDDDIADLQVTPSDYSDAHISEVNMQLVHLQQVLTTFEEMRVNDREHAHLRALCLFSPDGVPDVLGRKLSIYQMKVLRSFKACCQDDDDRMSSLLLRLPSLRQFSAAALEDIFFVGCVGDVNIDEVIPYLLNAER